MNDIKINCAFCNFDLMKLKHEISFNVFVNDKFTMICKNCWMRHFKLVEHKCSVCDKPIDYGIYFFKKGNNISLVCKECYDRMYGDKK